MPIENTSMEKGTHAIPLAPEEDSMIIEEVFDEDMLADIFGRGKYSTTGATKRRTAVSAT